MRDGRGIKPDIELTPDTLSNISFYLSEIVDSTDTFYDWVSNYCQTHETIAKPADFELADDDFNDFRQHVIDNKFKYDRVSSEMLKRLTEAAKAEGYYDDAKDEFTALENKLNHNTEKDLDKNKQEIKQLLATDILSYYYFRRRAIECSLKHDPVFNKAVELLNDEEAYNKILHVSCKWEQSKLAYYWSFGRLARFEFVEGFSRLDHPNHQTTKPLNKQISPCTIIVR